MPPRSLHRLLAPLLLAGLSVLASPARSAPPEPRSIRVTWTTPEGRAALLESGLDVVQFETEHSALVFEWPGDQATIERLGFAREVVDETPGRTAARRAAEDRRRLTAPAPRRVRTEARAGVHHWESLPALGWGSMGGFRTTSEIKAALDDLVADDPNDVVADAIDTIGTTWQGRPIWALELGKRIAGPDTRPAVLLNGLTHAREPAGMELVLAFARDLVDGYGVDDFATWILDHRRIVIVPLVNPDGYAENEQMWAQSGGTSFGQWRKNTRDNNHNGIYDEIKDGVDINRNFGWRWGKDNTGSSRNQSDADYRGPAAFSEPESRAQRDLVNALRPVTALTFHSFSALYYHAWANTDSLPRDVDAFHEWSDLLTRDNGYQTGGGALGLYPVNGDFADWCYGDTLAKPAVFAWTPEVGSDADGFWPPTSRLIAVVEDNRRACLMAAGIAGPFVQVDGVELPDGGLPAGRVSRLALTARDLGATGVAGPELQATLVSLDSGASVLGGPVDFPALGSRQSAPATSPFAIAVDDTVTPGRRLRFAVAFTDAQGLYSPDTIEARAGIGTTLALDGASSLAPWSTTSWGVVANDPAHPSRYLADSPTGNYAANADKWVAWTAPFDLAAGVHAEVEFDARWELEKVYDAVTIEASRDGTNWEKLPATGSRPGSGGGLQVPASDPYYTGTRWRWRHEHADLSPFTGAGAGAVRIRWRLRSNASLQFGGFALDSVRVSLYDPAAQPQPAAVDGPSPVLALALDPPRPNPARGRITLGFSLPRAAHVALEVLDLAGRRVHTIANRPMAAGPWRASWDPAGEGGVQAGPGIYFVRLAVDGATAVTRRVVVLGR